MRLLALDQSSKITGFSVFEDEKLIDSGIFAATDDSIGKRLVKIRNKIYELIDKYDIDQVVFEDIQLQNNKEKNVYTHKVLSEVFGVVEESLTERGVSYDIIHSETWKSTLGIKGREREEQKANAQKYVLKMYNKEVSSDEADAICIGTCYNLTEVGLF